MNAKTMKNIHTGETIDIDLVCKDKRNGTTIYTVRYQGTTQTLTGYQGWYIVK